MVVELLAILLFLLAWKLIIPLITILFNYTLGIKMFSTRPLLKKAGEWAIVTGATDGIGKAFAYELAKDGLNIMLVSRNQEKLRSVASEIESLFGVRTKTVACDFTQTDIYDDLEKEIKSLSSIACLVNNVGVSYPNYDAYATADFMDFEFIQNLVACNTISMATMIRIVLPILLKQNNRGSAIINLASFSGVFPSPFLALYGASKAFVIHFTDTLRQEVNGSNVQIQTMSPLLVVSALSKVKRKSFFIPDPKTYVSSALSMLGVEGHTFGYWPHALQNVFVGLAPSLILKSVGRNLMRKAHHKKKVS